MRRNQTIEALLSPAACPMQFGFSGQGKCRTGGLRAIKAKIFLELRRNLLLFVFQSCNRTGNANARRQEAPKKTLPPERHREAPDQPALLPPTQGSPQEQHRWGKRSLFSADVGFFSSEGRATTRLRRGDDPPSKSQPTTLRGSVGKVEVRRTPAVPALVPPRRGREAAPQGPEASACSPISGPVRRKATPNPVRKAGEPRGSLHGTGQAAEDGNFNPPSPLPPPRGSTRAFPPSLPQRRGSARPSPRIGAPLLWPASTALGDRPGGRGVPPPSPPPLFPSPRGEQGGSGPRRPPRRRCRRTPGWCWPSPRCSPSPPWWPYTSSSGGSGR